MKVSTPHKSFMKLSRLNKNDKGHICSVKLGPCQTSMMEIFAKTVNKLKVLAMSHWRSLIPIYTPLSSITNN